ncbi:PH domain-containing protein [Halorubrum sp. CGM5_25_10-8B]|uniref:PH domain-containing protein n=1 Tax=Halorubrum sp. CGM5_25_10-8B TaxID=2518115 RepID=UPI0010F9D166|nr:PH domain-containing protein [Halorubrum sp. CGM5_25_10-8B]TKX35841.1 PH domain-containing protein [Halorubrum sp. CGM5_25_10-8B]
MTGDWWFRHDDETVVWTGRPRLSAALGGGVVGVATVAVALLAAAAVDPRIAAASPLGVGIAGWELLRVTRTDYVVTTRAIWSKRGVLGRKVRRVGLAQVQNTAYSQSVTGSALGYGTVTIEVAGGPDLELRRINDPQAVRRSITDRTGTVDREPPGTVEQWRAVLSVVRDIEAAVD